MSVHPLLENLSLDEPGPGSQYGEELYRENQADVLHLLRPQAGVPFLDLLPTVRILQTPFLGAPFLEIEPIAARILQTHSLHVRFLENQFFVSQILLTKRLDVHFLKIRPVVVPFPLMEPHSDTPPEALAIIAAKFMPPSPTGHILLSHPTVVLFRRAQ